jgi:VIT1/CCC1 family predicted Fe2+/Mn2+ transporter
MSLTTSQQEHAELVRDARALIAGIERLIRRTGAVFVTASALTILAMAFDLRTLASITSTAAVLAFMAALVVVVARISLGAVPEPLDEPDTATEEVAGSRPNPAEDCPWTGSNR